MAIADATRERIAPSWPWGPPEECGCCWLATLGAPGADPEPLWVPCEEHAEQALRAVLEDVRTAYCPACGSELQEEGLEFWCTTCAGPVSRAAAEGA